MSIASHFFVATPEEAARNDGFEAGSDDRLAVFYRVMDTNLQPLYEIISAESCPEFEPVAMSDDFMQVTFAFPSEFVSQLATFDGSRFDSVIAEWSRSEDAPYDNERDLRDLFSALLRLAGKASESNLKMYLWNA